jgi:mannose-6-phosphate isomerase-like protein (cupin superfamily)
MRNFLHIAHGIDTAALAMALKLHPELWDAHTLRKTRPGTPHNEMSDIWVRYNDMSKYPDGDYSTFNEPHFPVWYPAYYQLPQLRPILLGLMARIEATHLGGVLITRIPPGGRVKPHVDRGWHPEFYRTKLYMPIEGNTQCINRVEDEQVVMLPGDVWYFNNLVEHEVINNGDTERITLIICMRTE